MALLFIAKVLCSLFHSVVSLPTLNNSFDMLRLLSVQVSHVNFANNVTEK
jgi:hypothetical protein